MGDSSGPKGPSIPSWQNNSAPKSTEASPKTTPDNKQELTAPPRSELIEHAKRFLEEDSIRDASKERKTEYLQTKGLLPEEIESLLDDQPTSPPSTSQDEIKTIHDTSNGSAAQAISSSSKMPSPATDSPSTSTQSPRADVPPIITYPEYLLRPAKPPPLITVQRLAYALYGVAGLSALTYGTSKYLVQPMLASLTSARHDLASTTLDHLEKLNRKLEENVSSIPPMPSSPSTNYKPYRDHKVDGEDEEDEDNDADTIDSDPTELYHRDIATQTEATLARSRRPSSSSLSSTSTSSSSPTSHKNPTTPSQAATSAQTTRLRNLHTQLASLLTDPDPDSLLPTPTHALNTSISGLSDYLRSLQFAQGAYSIDYSNGYGVNSGSAGKSLKDAAKARKEEDEAEKFKQEIRAVKGALLSAKSFPSGRMAVGGGVR